MKKNKKEKTAIIRFIDELILIINKISHNFMNLKTKKLVKYILELLILIIFIRLLKIPFDLIKELAKFVSYYLFPISGLFINIWAILVELLYFIFSIITFIFIYNKKYPDTKMTKIEKEEYKTIFTNLYKMILILTISFPLFISLLLLAVSFLVNIYLLFEGVTYYGITLVVVSLFVINIIILNKIYYYLIKRKINYKLFNSLEVVMLFIFALGLTLFSFEMINTKFFIKEIPPIDYPIKSDTLSTKIENKMKIICEGCDKKYELIYDNKLNNQIIIEISYYEQFVQSMFSTDRNLIVIKGRNINHISSEMKLSLINDLKKKHIYNYSLLYKKQLTVWVNEKNIDNVDIVIK